MPEARPSPASDPISQIAALIEERTDWQVFGLAQTDKIEVANGRMKDAMGIIERCEARDQVVADRFNAPWWKRPFMRKPDG